MLKDLLGRFGVAATFVDGTDVANFEAALTERTRLIVLESPNSMTFEQQDLAAVAALARARGIRTLCDNSYATPLNQSPIALGIDLVAHSATKYLNGHSDVVAGVLCGSTELIREVFRGPYMPCSASGIAQPITASPICERSMPGALATAARITCASRSSGRVLRNTPRGALPTGVRTAETM